MRTGEKIRNAREKLGLTQAQLADRVGFSHAQTVSDIERGERALKAAEAGKIGRALYIDYWELLGAEEEQEEREPCVIWRMQAGMAGEAEQRFVKKCRQYRLVEEANGTTQNRVLWEEPFEIAGDPYRRAREIAQRASREFNLGDRPASALPELLENEYNVKVWYFDLNDHGSSACTDADFGKAILVDAAEAPWRRNWDFAHEVFHLLTWQHSLRIWQEGSDDERELVEKCANAFAASLLLPSGEVAEVFDKNVEDGKISYRSLVEIAREFDVSTEALLYRLISLHRIPRETVQDLLSDERFRALDRKSMAPNWWQPPELPERFVRMAFFAYKQGDLSRARLAEFLETDLLRLRDRLEEFYFCDEFDYNQMLHTD